MAAPKARGGSPKRVLHLNRVQEMLTQGYGTCAIARVTDRSPATITRDKQKILEEWRVERLENVDREKSLALAQTEAVLFEAWQAYAGQSQNDPQFLRIVLDAIKRKSGLLGLDSPKGVQAEVMHTQAPVVPIEETMALIEEAIRCSE